MTPTGERKRGRERGYSSSDGRCGCAWYRKLSAQLAAAQELLQHNEKEAAAREESLSQALAAGKEAREATLSRDTTIRTLNVELSDCAINVERLEKVEVSLREALQTEKDKVVQLRAAELALQEATIDLQNKRDEEAKRMVALREQNEALQQQLAEAADACHQERQQIRVLKQRLSEFEERSKDLESVVEREQAELNRQRAARKETEKHNTTLMAKQADTDKAYKAREAAAVKALSEQLQKLKDNARQQLEDVSSSFLSKVEEADEREREARNALSQCQNELRRLLDERKAFQTRANSAEIEAERLQTELRQNQERERGMEADLKNLRREKARLEEAVDAAEKATAAAALRCDALHAKVRQAELDLKDKELEVESANVNTDRVQNELLHERRLTQAARSQVENVDKQLQLANTKLSEEKQKARDMQNQLSEAERRVGQITSELEAKDAQLDGSRTDAHELVQCRKDLYNVRHALEQAQAQLQDVVPAREAAERELAKLRHTHGDLVAKVRWGSSQALPTLPPPPSLPLPSRFIPPSLRSLRLACASSHSRPDTDLSAQHRKWTQASRSSFCSGSSTARIKCCSSAARALSC